MARGRVGIQSVAALKPGKILWDTVVSGFGARRQKSKAVRYVLAYRNKDGRQRWHVIGRHGSPWTPDTARAEAKRLLGQVVDGADPAADKRAIRKAETVADLCKLYLADAEAGKLLTRRKRPKKTSTLATDRGRLERHIKPLLGTLKVRSVTREDIERFMHDVADGKTAGSTKTAKKRGLARVRGGKGTASRTVGLLGAIFTYAVKHRMRGDNPVRGVEREADGKRTRRISEDEYKALGNALRKATEAQFWPAAVAVGKFLGLTGWRSGEALGLFEGERDLARRVAMLPDTKTGQSARPLSHAACDVLKTMAHGKAGALVFPASRGAGRMSGFPKIWAKIAKLGGLPADVTPHVLRHSFASVAADLGYSE